MRMISLCPGKECRWYDRAKPEGRACYYGEPQCWKGWLDIIAVTLMKRSKNRAGAPKSA